MANKFARGFTQTFGASFLRGQETAEIARKERKKLKLELEAGSKIASALKGVEGIPEEIITGLDEGSISISEAASTITAISGLQKQAALKKQEGKLFGKKSTRKVDQALPDGLAATDPSRVSGVRDALIRDRLSPESRITQARVLEDRGGRLVPVSETRKTVGGLLTQRFEVPSGIKLKQELKKKQALKQQEDLFAAQKGARGTLRFAQQFKRSFEELEEFDPNVGKTGFGGFITRKKAFLAEKVDLLPETSALLIRIQPLANGMARDIEGGRVTDQDRKIYADSFANAIKSPSVTNVRLLSSSIISNLDKGANMSNILIQLAEMNMDIMNNVIGQVLDQFPDLVTEIYGEGFEVTND